MRIIVSWLSDLWGWLYDTRAFHVLVGVIAYNYWGWVGVVCVMAAPVASWLLAIVTAILFYLTQRGNSYVKRDDISDEEFFAAVLANDQVQ